MVSLGSLATTRRSYMRLGALDGQSLVQANTIVNTLSEKWSVLQRDVTEAVQRNELPRTALAEVDAVASELEGLTAQIFEIEAAGIGVWLSWSQSIDRKLNELSVTYRGAIDSSRRIRALRIGAGFLVAAGAAAGIGYVVFRNRKGSRK